MAARGLTLELDGVSHRYARADVIIDFGFCTQPGEYVTIVGPSGSGKTTLLRLIAGLERVKTGRILFDGQDVSRRPPRDRDVAMVFQDASLYAHMTAGKNMRFGTRWRGLRRDEVNRRINEVARQLGLSNLLDRKPWQLSGGEAQRVAIGRALVRNASCLLMDEPLSDLDAPLRRQLAADLKAIHARQPRTTLHVTHDQREALTLGDRVIVLCNGRIQQMGTGEELYAAPANRFVGGFIGDSPMNFIDGELQSRDGRLRFRSTACDLDLSSRNGLADAAGRTVSIGIRPESVCLQAGKGAETVAVTVRAVSTIGSAAEVEGRLVDETPMFITTEASNAPRAGEVVHAAIGSQDVYIFEQGPFGLAL